MRDKSLVCNEPKVNEFMINQGKQKISNIKNLGLITPEVMDKLHDIMKPIDERKEFKNFWAQKKFAEQKR